MADVFLSAGVRTPFVKAGGVYARRSALELSIPVVKQMCAQTRPDLLVWGVPANEGLILSSRASPDDLLAGCGITWAGPSRSTSSSPSPGIEPVTNGITLRGSQCMVLHGIGSGQNARKPRKSVGRSVQIQCSD
jgi:hypothetical protein